MNFIEIISQLFVLKLTNESKREEMRRGMGVEWKEMKDGEGKK
jgi:hypothetical protein